MMNEGNFYKLIAQCSSECDLERLKDLVNELEEKESLSILDEEMIFGEVLDETGRMCNGNIYTAVFENWGRNINGDRNKLKDKLYEAISFLIDKGISVKKGHLIPRFVAGRCSLKLIQLLKEHGAGLNDVYNFQTGLMYACNDDSADLGKIKYFLDENADVNYISHFSKKNALMVFCSSYGANFNFSDAEIEADYPSVAKELIRRTTDLDAQDYRGHTAYRLAKNRAESTPASGNDKNNYYWLAQQIINEKNNRKEKG